MSISYEEALATLQSMFGDSWSREDLDVVLRNQKGHMENTCDVILRHGDKDPQVLIDQLQRGVDPQETTRSMDEQLARQLAQGEQRRAAANNTSAAAQPAGRGKPTTLPDDFLRIPGASRPFASGVAAASGAATNNSVMDDEALARMLQDELFSEELARNPDFAHLARGGGRGRPRTVGGLPGALPRSGGAGQQQNQQEHRPSFNIQQQSGQIIEKISELGDTARRRLQMMAAQFNAKNTSIGNPNAAGAASAAGRVSASERRGLLDDDNMDDMELAARKDL